MRLKFCKTVMLGLLTIAAEAPIQPRAIDGDTVALPDRGRVRLACVDAPERQQPGGSEARSALARMMAGRSISLIPHGTDRYGRVVGTVLADDESLNQRMVAEGWAWVYYGYLRGCDQAKLIEAENQARSARRGLWGLGDQPCAPWLWRRGLCDQPSGK